MFGIVDRIKMKFEELAIAFSLPQPPFLRCRDLAEKEDEVKRLYKEIKNEPDKASCALVYEHAFNWRKKCLEKIRRGEGLDWRFDTKDFKQYVKKASVLIVIVMLLFFLSVLDHARYLMNHDKHVRELSEKRTELEKSLENEQKKLQMFKGADKVIIKVRREGLFGYYYDQKVLKRSDVEKKINEIQGKIKAVDDQIKERKRKICVHTLYEGAFTSVSLFVLLLAMTAYYYRRDFWLGNFFAYVKGYRKYSAIKNSDDTMKKLLYGYVDMNVHNNLLAIARAIRKAVKWGSDEIVSIGTATGIINESNVMGYETGADVFISKADLPLNTFAFGGIGTGKTTSVLMPIFHQIMDFKSERSVALFDVKSEYQFTKDVAKKKGFKVLEIDDEKLNVNLFLQFDRAELFTVLKNFMETEVESKDQFWNISASRVIADAFTLLRKIKDDGDKELQVTVENVFRAISDVDVLTSLFEQLQEDGWLEEDREYRNLKISLIDNYANLADNTRTSILATISVLLNDFLACESVNTEETFDFNQLLEDNCFLYVRLRDEKMAMAARLYRYMIFEKIFDTALSRLGDKSKNQTRYVYVFADEVQEIANHQSFRKTAISRAAKLAFICATQSYSQMLQKMRSKHNADTMLANFRNRIYLNSSDLETRELMRKDLAEVDKIESNASFTFTKSSQWNLGALGGLAAGGISGAAVAAGTLGLLGLRSWGRSRSWTKGINVKREIASYELIDSLTNTQALCILVHENVKRKEIVDLRPVYD